MAGDEHSDEHSSAICCERMLIDHNNACGHRWPNGNQPHRGALIKSTLIWICTRNPWHLYCGVPHLRGTNVQICRGDLLTGIAGLTADSGGLPKGVKVIWRTSPFFSWPTVHMYAKTSAHLLS